MNPLLKSFHSKSLPRDISKSLPRDIVVNVNRQDRPRTRPLTLLGLLVMLAVLSACGGGTPSTSTTSVASTALPSPTSSSPTQNPTDSSSASSTEEAAVSAEEQSVSDSGVPLVASVNGVGITQEAFDRALARSQQIGAIAADENALSQTVLDILIEQAVIEQAAAEMNITVSDAEVDADVQNMITQAGSPEAWEQWKTDNLYTDEEYREAARSQFLTLRVRDQVIAENYPTQAGQEGGVRQVHARHILVSSEAEARDIMQRLQNGESFEALALQFSRDVTTRERGGDLGFFIREDLTTPELADAAFGLQPGEVTGPIATALGYHILQTLEFGTGTGMVANEDVARQQETVFNNWLQAQMASAQIERFIQ